MSINLVVEDGKGKHDANTYVSLDVANSYIQMMYGYVQEWDKSTEEEKKRAILHGTRFVESFNFLGSPLTREQALSWPRVTDPRTLHVWHKIDEIPDQITHANIEAALKYAQGEGLFPETEVGTVQAETSTVGPITKQVQYSVPRGGKRFAYIESLLKPFICSGSVRKVTRSIG